ncbi:BTAD domain-containing putative transcriptional regulator [Streptacidiphilus sp. ASG 303]|uniref:BTAD domain-containing putative transcriptional regulator n=1 Tax=Streptacidiphilus sp. ASG 303 TaxID=2896847 RepID=UPI0035AF87BD
MSCRTVRSVSGACSWAPRAVREGLRLWRGTVLSGIDAPFAGAPREHLEARRFAAQEFLADLDLALGRHRDLVPDLSAMPEAHPTREEAESASSPRSAAAARRPTRSPSSAPVEAGPLPRPPSPGACQKAPPAGRRRSPGARPSHASLVHAVRATADHGFHGPARRISGHVGAHFHLTSRQEDCLAVAEAVQRTARGRRRAGRGHRALRRRRGPEEGGSPKFRPGPERFGGFISRTRRCSGALPCSRAVLRRG